MSDDINNAKRLFMESLEFQFNGNLILAKNSLEKALELVPNRKSIINNLLVINFTLKDAEGLDSLIEHTEKFNDDLLYFNDLAKAYKYFVQKDYFKAIEASLNILEKKIEDIKGHGYDILIKSYFKICNIEKLFFYLRLSLKSKINHEQNLYNLGSMLQYLSKPRAAIYFINKSLKIKENVSYHTCLAQSYLKLKDFKKGLQYWESRLANNNINTEINDSVGSIKSINQIKNKKILVTYEQGLGDTIHFSRYLKKLIHFCDDISFLVQDKLFEVFSNLDEKIKIVKIRDIKNQNYDFQIPLVSILKLLDQSYSDIFYSQLKVKNVEDQIDLDSSKLNIAFAFQGNSNYICDQFRSIPFENYKNIFNQKKVTFYNLANPFINELSTFQNIKDVSQLSFLELSNFINRVDQIITTDTVFAHLCGSLNIKCIMLLSKNSEWRWFDDNKRTIWYPSIRILKQKKLNDWKGEIDIINKFINLKSNKY